MQLLHGKHLGNTLEYQSWKTWTSTMENADASLTCEALWETPFDKNDALGRKHSEANHNLEVHLTGS